MTALASSLAWTLAVTPPDGSPSWRWAELLVKAALTLWMVYISYGDHMRGRIPNRMTAPVFLGVGLYRLVEGVLHLGDKGWLQVIGLLVAWSILFGMWICLLYTSDAADE